MKYVTVENATQTDGEFLRKYFKKEIKPFLVPMVLGKGNPFPFLNQKMMYACVKLNVKDKSSVGIIPVDENIKRFILLPTENGEVRFALAEDLILCYADSVFKNYDITGRTLFKITRNADLEPEEASFDHDIDYRDFMGEMLKKRKKQAPVRLQLFTALPLDTLDFLIEKLPLKIKTEQVFYTTSPLDFSWVFSLKDTDKNPEMRFPKAVPAQSAMINNYSSVMTQIRRGDILLCYPYESIRPFIKLLEEAATDINVKSIKITLYRLAKNSKVIDALVSAVENGKDVTVLVELRARFDEENNIGWSRKLEHAGCKVIYGPRKYKVHSKLLLITSVRKKNQIEYITQIGTGNYNEKTSTLYTDFSLLTDDFEIGKDAEKLFKLLTKDVTQTPTISGFDGKNSGLSEISENSETVTIKDTSDNTTITVAEPDNDPEFSHLLVSPLNLRSNVAKMIDYEISQAKLGFSAYVGAKMNSLTDKFLIDKLIEASQAGVKVELIIRGICCLVAGIPGVTENVTVTSIVGRFLEHSRIYIFGTGDDKKIYISSADYMTRNTVRRIEVATPILSPKISDKIMNMFLVMLRDNVKGRMMLSDGNYVKKEQNVKNPLCSQEFFIEQANIAAKRKAEQYLKRQENQKIAKVVKQIEKKSEKPKKDKQ
ncbi:MAG: polyphosphate kinase [Oscillospiraceae bacterium]|nr:polyphosphate kinase [Oscillospiraceae bacterium]